MFHIEKTIYLESNVNIFALKYFSLLKHRSIVIETSRFVHRGKPLDIIIKYPKDLVMSQTTIAKALCKYYPCAF